MLTEKDKKDITDAIDEMFKGYKEIAEDGLYMSKLLFIAGLVPLAIYALIKLFS